MTTPQFALVLGIIYTLVGLAGFLPGVVASAPPDAPRVQVDAGYGYLVGLFPVNILHTLVHLAIGIWGLVASRRLGVRISAVRLPFPEAAVDVDTVDDLRLVAAVTEARDG